MITKPILFSLALLFSATCLAGNGNETLPWAVVYRYSITYPNPGIAYPRASINISINKDSTYRWKHVHSRGPDTSIVREGESVLSTEQVERLIKEIEKHEVNVDIPYQWMFIEGRESGWGGSIALSSSIEDARNVLATLTREHTQRIRQDISLIGFLNKVVFDQRRISVAHSSIMEVLKYIHERNEGNIKNLTDNLSDNGLSVDDQISLLRAIDRNTFELDTKYIVDKKEEQIGDDRPIIAVRPSVRRIAVRSMQAPYLEFQMELQEDRPQRLLHTWETPPPATKYTLINVRPIAQQSPAGDVLKAAPEE